MARLLAVFREGSTWPALAETEAGGLFVLKLAGAGPGPRALLTEFLATRIAAHMGLTVPEVRPLLLPDGFPWQAGTDEFDGLVQRSYGWNLGIGYIADAVPVPPSGLGALPARFLARLRRVDRLLQNIDRTAANPNLLRDAANRVWAIDHNACLFLERIAADRRPYDFTLPAGHFLARTSEPPAGAPGDGPGPAAAGRIDGGAAARLAASAPDAWLDDGLRLSRDELARRLAAYLDAFSAQG